MSNEFTEQEIRTVEVELFEKRIISRIPARTAAKAVLRSRKTYGDTSDETVTVPRADLAAVVCLPVAAFPVNVRGNVYNLTDLLNETTRRTT